jgi:hypothetical protein
MTLVNLTTDKPSVAITAQAIARNMVIRFERLLLAWACGQASKMAGVAWQHLQRPHLRPFVKDLQFPGGQSLLRWPLHPCHKNVSQALGNVNGNTLAPAAV